MRFTVDGRYTALVPRPRESSQAVGGGVVGALVGAAFGPAGALVGGALGAAIGGQTPLPLDESIRRAFTERKVEVVRVQRPAANVVEVLFRDAADVYLTLVAQVPYRDNAVVLEDNLFDQVIATLDEALE